ncbi:MAG: hypothetical protein K6A23_11135 [Butyrivibrio sp.]|nr:hypothetical protein [Butyrivibrio sp.]
MKFKFPNKKNNPTFYYGFIVVIAVFVIANILTRYGEDVQDDADDWSYPAEEYASYYASIEDSAVSESSISTESDVDAAVLEAQTASKAEEESAANAKTTSAESKEYKEYTFRYDNLLQSHYEKHGIEMGFDSPEEYLAAANAVVNNPNALHKYEKEDGDDVYYVEDTQEFVVVSTDGFIRTYYYASLSYFNRQ